MQANQQIILGIDIGGTKTSLCLGTAPGQILASARIPSGGHASIQQYVRALADLYAQLLDQKNISRQALSAVGISAPGPLDTKRGLLIAPANNPDWRDVPIVALIEDLLQVPVYINNDANACALAEYIFGAYRGTPDLIYLTFSTGMGGGVIVNGQLLQGISDSGGEVGHQVLDPRGPLCGCGMRGCWEAYVGGRRVAERLQAKIRAANVKTSLVDKVAGHLEAINMNTLVAAVQEGDPFALSEWDALIERLAQGIGNLIMILNPQVVLLGTIAIHAGALVMQPLREKLPKYAWPWPLQACQIAPSTLGADIGNYAALAIAIGSLSKINPTMQWGGPGPTPQPKEAT